MYRYLHQVLPDPLVALPMRKAAKCGWENVKEKNRDRTHLNGLLSSISLKIMSVSWSTT